MRTRVWACWVLLAALFIAATWAFGQQNQNKAPQDIPDAPSASRPPQPLPTPSPGSPAASAPPASAGDSQPPGPSQPPSSDPAAAPTEAPSSPRPATGVKTVAPGKESPYATNTRDEIYTLRRNV